MDGKLFIHDLSKLKKLNIELNENIINNWLFEINELCLK
jgi:hypothetical protein